MPAKRRGRPAAKQSAKKQNAGSVIENAPIKESAIEVIEEVTEENNALEALRQLSILGSDSGDFNQLQDLHPQDATTNPTLILSAAKMTQYKHLVDDAIQYGKAKQLTDDALISEICDRLIINFGKEILQIIPGVVSTEVDASLSFNTQASILKAHKFIDMYEEVGVKRDRILIKLASTWEGVKAAEILEREGTHCNMTLLFSLPQVTAVHECTMNTKYSQISLPYPLQAVAAAEAGATLVSPFVGRILDWWKTKHPENTYNGPDDPGVQSVTKIYNYYKFFGYKTVVMGASFRSVEQILEIAGCDKLTISPKLLMELKHLPASRVSRKLNPEGKSVDRLDIDEPTFRYTMIIL